MSILRFIRTPLPRASIRSLISLHSRRLIGRPFSDPVVKKDIESWPFKVIEQGSSGNPIVQVEYLGETKTFSPQEISAMVLTKVSRL